MAKLLMTRVDIKVYSIYIHTTEIVHSFFGNNFQGKKKIRKLEVDEDVTINQYLYKNIVNQIVKVKNKLKNIFS